MRAVLHASLAVLILLPVTALGQANWTPKSESAGVLSALRGVSVGMVTLSPEAARGQYNIQISKEQEFVIVQGIEEDSRAGRSAIVVGDLIDTVILGGEEPRHGSVTSVAEFERLASLCVPACLVVVRHRFSQTSDVNSLGPIQDRFVISGVSLAGYAPHLYRVPNDDATGMCGNLTHDPEEAIRCGDFASYGFCDGRTGYLYFAHQAASVEDNWLSPREVQKRFGGASCQAITTPPAEKAQSSLRGIRVRGENEGAVVTSVAKGSPADAAGIRPGDTIWFIWVPDQVPPYAIHDEEDMAWLAPHCAPDCILDILAARPGSGSPTAELLLGGTGFSYLLSICDVSSPALGENLALNLNQLNAAGNDFNKIRVHKRGYDGCIDRDALPLALIPGMGDNTIASALPAKECCTHPDMRFKAAMAQTAGLKGPSSPSGPTTTGIELEIERIRTGQHAAMTTDQAAPSALGGQTSIVVDNSTEYTLTVFLSGPVQQRVDIGPRGSQMLNLTPGQYEVAARVSNPAVIPFYGQWSCGPNTRYSEHVYIASQIH